MNKFVVARLCAVVITVIKMNLCQAMQFHLQVIDLAGRVVPSSIGSHVVGGQKVSNRDRELAQQLTALAKVRSVQLSRLPRPRWFLILIAPSCAGVSSAQDMQRKHNRHSCS